MKTLSELKWAIDIAKAKSNYKKPIFLVSKYVYDDFHNIFVWRWLPWLNQILPEYKAKLIFWAKVMYHDFYEYNSNVWSIDQKSLDFIIKQYMNEWYDCFYVYWTDWLTILSKK